MLFVLLRFMNSVIAGRRGSNAYARAEVESDAESVASTVPAFWLQGGTSEFAVCSLQDMQFVDKTSQSDVSGRQNR